MAVGGGCGEGTGGIGGEVEDIHSIDSRPMSRQQAHRYAHIRSQGHRRANTIIIYMQIFFIVVIVVVGCRTKSVLSHSCSFSEIFLTELFVNC